MIMTRKPESALLRLNSLTGLRFFAAFHVGDRHQSYLDLDGSLIKAERGTEY